MEIQLWDFKHVIPNTTANTVQKFELPSSGTFWVIKKNAEFCVNPPRLTLYEKIGLINTRVMTGIFILKIARWKGMQMTAHSWICN